MTRAPEKFQGKSMCNIISVNYLISHSEHANVACIKIMKLITTERKCQHRESNRHRFETGAEANRLSSFIVN